MPSFKIGVGRFLMFACGICTGVCPLADAEENPFGPIHVAANRHQYAGNRCPVDIVYTATINFNRPHPKGFAFNYHWERSDGAKTGTQVVRTSPNQQSMVLRQNWRLGAPGHHYDASDTLVVNSGNTHLKESSPVVSISCK